MYQCLFCRKMNITDIDQPICKNCQTDYPDLDTSAAWFASEWDVEAKERKAQRQQEAVERNPKRYPNHIIDPTPAELGNKSLDDVIENVEGDGAIEPFKDNPHARIFDAEVIKQVDAVTDVLHAKGVKGYDPNDLSNARKWIVLTAYMQADIKDNLAGTQWSDPDWMYKWVNSFLKSKGQKPMSKHRFKKTLQQAKKEVKHHGMLRPTED